MNRITIELWLWLGKEMGEDFNSPSEMRSVREEEVNEGTTIRQLLYDLAKRYSPIAQNIFNINDKKIFPHVVMTYNDMVISPHIVHDQILGNGDKITILPMYMGG
jgi:sulfur carrier protein ThiS